MKKIYLMSNLFFVFLMFSFIRSMPIVPCDYINWHGSPVVIIDTVDGIRVVSNLKNQAKIWNVNGDCLAKFNQEDVWSIAVASQEGETYYFVSLDKTLTLFDHNYEQVASHTFHDYVMSVTPIIENNQIYFMVCFRDQNQQALLSTIEGFKKNFTVHFRDKSQQALLYSIESFINNKTVSAFEQAGDIISCANVNTPWGHCIITSSRNFNSDGFFCIWDCAGKEITHINSMSWFHSVSYSINNSLPDTVKNLWPNLNKKISQNYFNDKVIAISATQTEDELAYMITGSENGAHIIEIKKNWVNFIEPLSHDNQVVRFVKALTIEDQAYFLTSSNTSIKLWNIDGEHLFTINPQLNENNAIEGLDALYKNDQLYIVAQDSHQVYSWTLKNMNWFVSHGWEISSQGYW